MCLILSWCFPLFLSPTRSPLTSCLCLSQTQAILSKHSWTWACERDCRRKQNTSLSCLHSSGCTRIGLTENGFHSRVTPSNSGHKQPERYHHHSSCVVSSKGHRPSFTGYLLFLRAVHTAASSCISSIYTAKIMYHKDASEQFKIRFKCKNNIMCLQMRHGMKAVCSRVEIIQPFSSRDYKFENKEACKHL